MTQSVLTSLDFPTFFEQVHGHPPFQWQVRATRELTEGKLWPSLEAPTGAGKTSLIDCLVFALACQAGGAERTVPLRTFWVVDRRGVVDQVYAHARRLWQAVAEGDGVVATVRERLEGLDGLGGLVVQRWRGGLIEPAERFRPTRSDLSEASAQIRLTGPAVICSTIDQVGSRLLFRGYGSSRRSRPLDAALTGTDSLIVLDEAHLAEPFLDTLSRIRDLAGESRPKTSVRRVHALTLSATLPSSAEEGFRLTGEERTESLISRRLHARKELRLVRKHRRSEALVAEARRLAGSTAGVDGAPPVIGLVANTVAEARAAHGALKGAGDDAILVIGPCRPYERDTLLARIPDRPQRSQRATSLFVVATQTIEVGLDLDFDALITATAPLPALVQRLGRLDRRGERYAATGSPSTAVIVSSREPCFVYGDVADKTWRWLDDRTEKSSLIVDAEAIAELRGENPPELEGALAPILGQWHLDALVQTSIDPVPSPAIGPFLHGEPALEQADVRVVWRADLGTQLEESWPEVTRLAPPQAHEAISLPIGRVRTWLDQPLGRGDDGLAFGDVESVAERHERPGSGGHPAVRWDPKEPEVVRPSGIRPGDTLIVPANYGGVDEFGWNPGEPQHDDVDVGNLTAGARRLRVHPALGYHALLEATSDVVERFEGGEIDSREAYSQALASLHGEAEKELAMAVSELPPYGEFSPYPNGVGFVLIGKSTGLASRKPRRVTYEEHVRGVTRRVGSTAEVLGLEGRIREALVLAARLHDSGKLDPRFQAWMNGGTPSPGVDFLAKSGREQGTSEDHRARRNAGWPRGMRHELWSAAFADTVAASEEWQERDLIGYLIAVHHGRHRPFYGRQPDLHPTLVEAKWGGEAVRLRSDARPPWPDHARRFRTLNRRFGPWGLAWLEAILVLSDHAVSAEEQEHESL